MSLSYLRGYLHGASGAGSAAPRFATEVINEGVGVQKNGITGRKVGEGHGPSSRSRSGAKANRRNSSAFPFQPQIP